MHHRVKRLGLWLIQVWKYPKLHQSIKKLLAAFKPEIKYLFIFKQYKTKAHGINLSQSIRKSVQYKAKGYA